MNLGRFLAIVKKYTEITALTQTILNEFVEKIIVHAPIKAAEGGCSWWKSDNCAGVIELPDTSEINSKTV